MSLALDDTPARTVPEAENEPVRDYAPGSPEAVSLHAVLDRVAGETRELPHVVAGRRWPLTSPVAVRSPHEHARVLGRYSPADVDVVDAAVGAALAARRSWARTPWQERAAVFLRAADLVVGSWREELLAATMLGQSKTFHQAEIDAACELADFFRYNAAFAQALHEDQPRDWPGERNRLDHRGLEGFVLAMSPFNFTAIAGNLPSTAALMGNAVVWKPSEKSALSSDVVMRVLEAAGLPPGVVNLVHGDGALVAGRAMAHREFAGLSFTGSSAVFRSLWARAAENVGAYRSYPRLVGETGGKNAIVAHPSADPDALLVAMVRGAFEFQGQKCSAASRAYLPRSLWRELAPRLTEVVGALPVGDVRDHATFVGAVIDEAALRRLEGVFRRVRSTPGHQVLVGGTVRPETGWFVDPTVVVTDDPCSFTLTEEFFGPLLAVHVYEDGAWEDTLRLVDGTSDYALTCSVFATDRAVVDGALEALRDTAGMIYVNDKPTGALIGRQSFGGGRASGTNDKVGSPLVLQRFDNARFVKENLEPPTTWTYPYMGSTTGASS